MLEFKVENCLCSLPCLVIIIIIFKKENNMEEYILVWGMGEAALGLGVRGGLARMHSMKNTI